MLLKGKKGVSHNMFDFLLFLLFVTFVYNVILDENPREKEKREKRKLKNQHSNNKNKKYNDFFEKIKKEHKRLKKLKEDFFLSERQKHILFFINNFKKYDSAFTKNNLEFSDTERLFELSNNPNINSKFDKKIIDFALNKLDFSDEYFKNHYKKIAKSVEKIIKTLNNNNIDIGKNYTFLKDRNKLIDFKEKIKTKNIPQRDKKKILANLTTISNWDFSCHLHFIDYLDIIKNYSEKIEKLPNSCIHPEKIYMTCDGLVWILESKINLTKFERSVFIFLKKMDL